MDFMRGERVYPVSYTLAPVSKSGGANLGVAKARWAEANIEEAAEVLRNIRRREVNRSNESCEAAR
jgi:hypothetical protein